MQAQLTSKEPFKILNGCERYLVGIHSQTEMKQYSKMCILTMLNMILTRFTITIAATE